MLLNIDNLVSEHNMDIRGVIHIGAHYGDEYEKFRSLGVKNFLFFEPNPTTFKKLEEHKCRIREKEGPAYDAASMGKQRQGKPQEARSAARKCSIKNMREEIKKRLSKTSSMKLQRLVRHLGRPGGSLRMVRLSLPSHRSLGSWIPLIQPSGQRWTLSVSSMVMEPLVSTGIPLWLSVIG